MATPRAPSATVVWVVDDDVSVRRALRRLIASAGLTVETFASAREFLDSPTAGGAAWCSTSIWKA